MEPTISGVAGRAWKLSVESDKPDHDASIASWLVNVPGAHPFWSHWLVGMCSLRDIPGVPPAKRSYPEAEFEFLIASIDPSEMPSPMPEVGKACGGFPLLSPFDVVFQFHGVIDADAGRICELAVRAMCDGRLSPDQDFRSAWEATLTKTVEHFRTGKHAVH